MPFVALTPPWAVTCTLTEPVEEYAGAVTVIWVELLAVNVVAATPPKLTPATPTKFVPVRTMLLPPPCGPLVGLTPVTVGAGVELV